MAHAGYVPAVQLQIHTGTGDRQYADIHQSSGKPCIKDQAGQLGGAALSVSPAFQTYTLEMG